MRGLRSKVALVTGGASGLGLAIAQRLSDEGAIVVITDVQVSLGRTTAQESGFHFIEQDVTDELRWVQVIGEVRGLYGALNILVNNAGILGSRDAISPQDTSFSDWRNTFSVNVDGVFLGCRAAIPQIHASGGGAIINISSVAGLMATPYATAYGASKAAVRQLTKSVAQHCAEKKLNIRCNSVHPGSVRTPLWDKQAEARARERGVTFERVLKESEALNPMGRLTLTEDVASAVAFLASEDAARITGEKLIVDGGSVGCDTYHLMRRQHEIARQNL